MLTQASSQDLANYGINKRHGHIVIVSRFYPRFIKKDMVSEYVSDLGPSKELLKEFNTCVEECGSHDLAFEKMEYQKKFKLNAEGMKALERLANLSRTSDVYLVCFCKRGEACHRELLMLMARERFGAEIGRVSRSYDVFLKRLQDDQSGEEPRE